MKTQRASRTPGRTTRSRYRGASPFRDQPEDHELFSGRGEDIELLHQRVLSVSLLVQFAKSGAGKTSLLRAGLFPRLREKLFFPILVRLNRDEPLALSVATAIEQACQPKGLDLTVGETSGLWELLAATFAWRDDLLLIPVLVFDQFEEVFTLRTREFREELARELGAVASGIPPERLHAACGGGKYVGSAKPLSTRPDVKIVISVREDYLGALEEFTVAIPQLFTERMRLAPISESGAREAIARPAALEAPADKGADSWSAPFHFESQALDEVIAFLKGKSGVIEPFQLQLVCQHAERIASEKAVPVRGGALPSLTFADLGGENGLASVLKGFYEDTIGKLPKPLRSKARRLCEEGLLDEAGHRLMLAQGQISTDYRLPDQALTSLVGGLLRREPRLDGVFYEISHDRLAESIHSARPFRLPARVRRGIWMGSLMALAFLGALLFGLGKAELARRDAVRERDRADRAFETVTQEKDRAEKLLGFLLGEELLREVRDVGRSEILESMQTRSEEYLLTDTAGTGAVTSNQGLAKRNKGDLERIHGHLAEALRNFREAEKIFTGLVERHGDDDRPRAELARTLTRIGEALTDRGHPSEAFDTHRRALEIRQGLHSSHPEDSMTAIELAECHRSIGVLELRMGAASEAEQSLKAAVHLALDHLFDPGVSGAANTDPVRTPAAILPRTAALRVLANSLLNSAIASWSEEAFNQALSVARDIAWASPLSAEGRQTEAVALDGRAIIVGVLDPPEALQDYRKVNASFDELLRWDPYNDLWRREWAATQIWVSEGILNCLQDKEQRCKNPAPDLREAERVNLEAIKQLRDLAEKGPDNVSWRSDVAWALSTRAKVLKEKKQPDERLQALHEAVELYDQAAVDPRDLDAQWNRAKAHRDQAAARDDQNKTGEAIEDQRRAREILETVVKEHPGHVGFRGELVQTLDGEIAFLRKNGDPTTADALERQKKAQQTELERLEAVDPRDSYQNEIWTEQWERGKKAEQDNKWDAALDAYRAGIETLNAAADKDPSRAAIWYARADAQRDVAGALAKAKRLTESVKAYREAIDSAQKAAELAPKNAEYQNRVSVVRVDLGAALNKSGDLEEALREFRASLEPLNTALRLNPTQAQYHKNESTAYDWITSTLEALSLREPERQDALREEREAALRKRVHASWRAAAFSPKTGQGENYHNLAMARRYLSKLLAFEKGGFQEARYLMEQARSDVERAVARDPRNPTYHCYLGEADYAAGVLRRRVARIGGWEEAIRKGLVSIDYALSLAPNEALCLKFSGIYRQDLGEELIKDHRVEAGQKELELAVSAYEKAQKLWPEDQAIQQGIEAVRVTLARLRRGLR